MSVPYAVFPPSVNWNLPQIAGSNQRIFAYGAKNRVVVSTYSDTESCGFVYRKQFEAHKDRIVALKCVSSVDDLEPTVEYIISAGDDGLIRAWSFDVRSCAVKLVHQHSIHKSKPVAVSYKLDQAHNFYSAVVASADSKGLVVLYQLSTQKYTQKQFDNSLATCIEFAPACQGKHFLAVSYKSGVIAIVDTSFAQLDLVAKVRSSDEKIENICWCPEIRPEELEKSWIPNLVSASADRTLRFFHVDLRKNSFDKTKSLFFKKLPVKVGSKKTSKLDSDAHAINRMFFFANWIAKDKILTGSLTGDLISWNVDFQYEKSLASSDYSNNRVLIDFKVADESPESGHSRGIQSITLFNDTILTHSTDRYLCSWKFPTLKNVSTRTTIGGSVFDIAISPISKTWLAVACGGGFLLVWNSSMALNSIGGRDGKESLDTRFKMLHVWQGYKTKVTVVCFHPNKEATVAFGTEDGKIGLFDVCNNKPALTSATFHSKTVYSMSFGPTHPSECKDTSSFGDTDSSFKGSKWFDLYSCGADGEIFVHNPSVLNVPAKNFNDVLQSFSQGGKSFCTDSKRACVCWNNELTHLAVGNQNGTIDVYNHLFQFLAVVELHGKVIYHLAWQFNCADGPESNPGCLLSVSCKNDLTVKVIDMSPVMGVETELDEALVISNLYCQLVGHKKKVTRTDWSPYDRDIILSTSNDGSVQIWKVDSQDSQKFLCNYLQNPDSASTCARFSLTHEDLVVSGGSDFIIYCWKPSETTREKPEIDPSGVEIAADLTVDNSTLATEQSSALNKNSSSVGERNAHCSLVDENSSGLNFVRGSEFLNEQSPKLGAGDACKPTHTRKPKTRTFLRQLANNQKVPQAIEETKDFFTIWQRKKEGLSNDVDLQEINGSQYGLFCGAVGAQSVIQNEINLCSDTVDSELKSDLLLLRGDVEKSIDVAINSGCLSQKHVAASFMGGFKLWKRAVEALSEQCMKNGEVNDACQYMLMLNKVHEAMKLLVNHGKFKDALVIGTMRLPENDSYLRSVYVKYADFCEQSGSLEVAAQCYLALDDMDKAVRVLTSRNNVEANVLALNMLLSQDTPSEVRVQFLVHTCVIKFLFNFEFEKANVVMKKSPLKLQHLDFVVSSLMLFVENVSGELNMKLCDPESMSSTMAGCSLFVAKEQTLEKVDITSIELFLHAFAANCELNLRKNLSMEDDVILEKSVEQFTTEVAKIKSQMLVTQAPNAYTKLAKNFILLFVDVLIEIAQTIVACLCADENSNTRSGLAEGLKSFFGIE